MGVARRIVTPWRLPKNQRADRYRPGYDITPPNDPPSRSQFWDTRTSEPFGLGLRRLAIALLTDAVDCLNYRASYPPGHRERLHVEAMAWVEAEGDGHGWSFPICCALLGIDADYLRKRLCSRSPACPQSTFSAPGG
jgi:hypothetical protein